MHFSKMILAAVQLAPLAAAANFSSSLDQDSTVWDAANQARSINRLQHPEAVNPTKRQSGWSPPSNLVTPLKEVWDHCLATYSDGLFGFKNYGWDQLIENGGSINYCVRWESSTAVTKAQRDQIATVLNTQIQKWFQWVYGWDNFPYSSVKVNVVGWAVKDTSLLQGDTSSIDVYTSLDSGGAPECAPACGRFYHQTGDYSGCSGGASHHYDHSLWLTDGFSGGAGGDWGQRISREYFMGALTTDNIHILLHEMGHTYGLDDFYDWTPTGITNFIMLSGSATYITDFDGWMYRNWWYELSRNRGWQTSTPASSSTTHITSSTTQATSTRTSTTTAATNTGLAQHWAQCGGSGYTGPTQCVSPYTCTFSNDYYSQCL